MSFNNKISWPDGKLFAFSILDDTDLATVTNVSPVYSFLENLDFRTTKLVWPIGGDPLSQQGSTCDDRIPRVD